MLKVLSNLILREWKMKKTPMIVTAILMALTANVWAGSSDQKVIDQAAKNSVTVAQATTLADETAVNLTGTIIRHIQEDHFELKDETGSIHVEVDDKLASINQLKAGTKVKVYGEVDTHREKATDIEVYKIEILK